MAERTGVHASDARLVYVGRHQVDSSTVSMDYTGTSVRLRFFGSHLSVRLKDTGTNYYNLYIDRPFAPEPDRILTTHGDTTIVLIGEKVRGRKGERAREHTVMLYKRTEGEWGRTTFEEFFTDGEILQAQPLQPRLIEVVGDSYTCGYGAENSGPEDRFSPMTETSAKTYAAILARYFDADLTLVAHSGMGIARNYNGKFAGWYMPDRYLQTFDMDSTVKWGESGNRGIGESVKPAITIILLGGNDFSTGQQPTFEDFSANYMRLLLQIKSNYGEQHPILCCVKKGIPALTDYVQRVVEQCGMPKVAFCPFYPAVFGDDSRYLGADKHPNYLAHRMAAHVLIPYVSTLTGWPLSDRAVE